MLRLNYITNLDVKNISGGWSGMNHNIYHQLCKKFELNLIQNINPQIDISEKLLSKIVRVFGGKGIFPSFSKGRLDRVASEVKSKMDKFSNLTYFHGATSWLHVEPATPYAMYVDASFASYMNVYHDKACFNKSQLSYLYEREAAFMESANAVFFSSYWSLNDAKKQYLLSGKNFHIAGLGGGLNMIYDRTSELTEPYFLFVALDFKGKGGEAVVNSFVRIRESFPSYKLKIVGEKPPENLLQQSGVEYVGFIDKSSTFGMQHLQALFKNAYCFLLPTSKDMTPLVILEASSLGCPVITTRSFGIPEMVVHNKTGILLDNGDNLYEELQLAMGTICSSITWRNMLGNNAREYVSKKFSWDKTGNMISEVLSKISQ